MGYKKFGKHEYESLGGPSTTKTQAEKWAINAEKRGYYTRIIKRQKDKKPIYQVYIRRKTKRGKR